MEINSIDAAAVKNMFLTAAQNLDSNKEWINELNVFPVPDGDTGTNMSMTIMSAAREVSECEDANMRVVAKAMSQGSLRGARGNSGVILSQLLRGFSRVIENYDKLDVTILAEASEKAVETAYKAVMKPKEGTILTVAKGACEKAVQMVHETEDIALFLKEVIAASEEVLEKTPDMLPVLKQAGVVDSGGQGLVVVLKGALEGLTGEEPKFKFEGTTPSLKPTKISTQTEEEIKFGYCTEFIIVLNNPVSDDRVNELKDFLENLGDSIVVVADDEIIKIHVHTNNPGKAIEEALTLGSLSRIKIDNMREEHQERLIKNSEELAKKQAKENKDRRAKKEENTERKKSGFISVSVGSGINEIFKSLGADYIIEGGQTMNPSTEDILGAIEKVNADTVYILPNNSNIILAATQAAQLCEDKDIVVIPTKTIPQGIAAIINYSEQFDKEENKTHMLSEIEAVKSGSVTYAVRDTNIDDKDIKKGDYMGIGDAGILSVGKELDETALDMISQMVDEDMSLITVYFGEEVTDEMAKNFEAKLSDKFSDLEIETEVGGQPIYYYIVSVE